MANFPNLEKLLKRANELNSYTVCVGVPREQNEQVGSQFNLASLAATLHFGSADGRIPPRPFITQTLEKQSEKYQYLFMQAVQNPENSAKQTLEKIALIMQGDVQLGMVNGNWTPNAPSTIKRKGSSKPLIDTGRLRQSIVGVVRNESN